VWPLLYLPAGADAQLSQAEHLGIGIEWGGATLSMRCYTMASFCNQVASWCSRITRLCVGREREGEGEGSEREM
jgi:hypothetical protein